MGGRIFNTFFSGPVAASESGTADDQARLNWPIALATRDGAKARRRQCQSIMIAFQPAGKNLVQPRT